MRGFSIRQPDRGALVSAKVRAHIPGACNELTTVLPNGMGDGLAIDIKFLGQGTLL